MKNLMITSLFMIAAMTFVSQKSQAGFLIEPYLGYETGDSNDTSSNGIGYGARAGLTTLGFMYGVDYSKGKITSTNTASIPFNYTDLSLFVGYDFPMIPIRVWLDYMLSSKMDYDSSGTYELTGKGGTKLGVGLGFFPLISINLEMINRKYDEVKFGATKTSTSADAKTYMLSVSVPLP